MAKIANVQLPVNQAGAALPVQSAKDAQGNSDFLAMLKQKGETLTQPDKPEVTDKAKEPLEKPETKEQPQDKEDLSEDGLKEAQAALEQLAAQMTVVTPEVVQPEPEVTSVEMPVVSEVVEAVMPEAVVEGAQESLLSETMVATQPEVTTKLTEEGKPEAVRMPVEAKKEPEANKITQPAQKTTQAQKEAEPVRTVEAKASVTTVQEESKEVIGQKLVSQAENSASTASATSTNGQETTPQAAVQQPVAQVESSFETTQTKSADFKSTIEELPHQLGKALSSGKLTGTQTLTIELEPASLGKLTVKVSYEAGRTAVSILASNPKSLEILNQKASEIAAILKEHTGEETVIYTQEPQHQEEDSYDGHQGSQSQEQKERSRHDEDKEQQTDSFAQQLRLGLV